MEKVRQREIKFRLYFYEGKRLTYSTHTFEVTDKRLHIMLARFEENTIVGFAEWTGLKDRNEVDIYEHDIVMAYNAEQTGYNDEFGEIMMNVKGKVIFEDGYFQYEGHSMGPIPVGYDLDNIEVIGNIYEHPHLLSQGEIKTELI